MKHQQDDAFEEFAREFISRHQGAGPRWPVERILVATDFSRCSLGALEHAEELTRRFGAELLLLHVDEATEAESVLASLSLAAAERELAAAIRHLREHQIRARSLLRRGAPSAEILEAARSERASLVVMGTHGRKGLGHVLMGSVAERVVRGAPCPVLTVGPQTHA